MKNKEFQSVEEMKKTKTEAKKSSTFRGDQMPNHLN